MGYVVNPNDPSTPTNDQGATQGAEELRALKTKMASAIAGALIATAAGANPADITTYIRPDINDRPAMVAGGWLPWNFNQQWGGAGCMPFHLIDSATSTEFKFDAFDAYIDSDGTGLGIGNVAGSFYEYQGITPAKNLSLQAIWLRLFKTLNPVDNVTVQLYSVAAGTPNALIATANVINGKQITSDANGQWYRFSFAAVQALVAGTQYAIVISKSGGVDAANFYQLLGKSGTRYPNCLAGVGTVAPVWTTQNTISRSFIAEAQASDQPIQSGGTFAGRIVGSGTGNPVNRSVGWIKPLREFFPLFDNNGWSILLRGKSWTKDATIADVMYGLHHDRINIRSAVGTGFTTVTVYAKDGTVTTLVGTSDISGATYKDILITGRTLGDGGDSIRIWTGINGVWSKEGELTAQTFSFDNLMRVQGHMWIMGGFQLFKTTDYTKLSTMAVLPSADGWTFTTTTATVEGNVFAISNGKLNQIKAGMAAGGDGNYNKAAAGFSNANGWLLASKFRIAFNTNTLVHDACELRIRDGVRDSRVFLQEYYANTFGAATIALPQIDLKTSDCTVFYAGKGNDNLLFVNGKLVADGTSWLTAASGVNDVSFGDLDVTANENADVLYSYLGYYNTSNIYPQFTAGELHEFAVFSGDKNLLGGTLYNAGVPLSVKGYCGIGANFIGAPGLQEYCQRGINSGPVSASVLFVTMPDLELFVLGSKVISHTQSRVNNTNPSGYTVTAQFIDGVELTDTETMHQDTAANINGELTSSASRKMNFGLHKLEVRWIASAANSVAVATQRNITAQIGLNI